MTRLVVDIEANGLYNNCSRIHCIVAKDIDTGEVFLGSESTVNLQVTFGLSTILQILVEAD